MSSIGGVIGIPFQAFYSASKFALEGYAESLAYEVEPFNVKVTLIEPGNFSTDFTTSRRLVEAPTTILRRRDEEGHRGHGARRGQRSRPARRRRSGAEGPHVVSSVTAHTGG